MTTLLLTGLMLDLCSKNNSKHQHMTANKARFVEIDILRSLAIIGMVLYHLLFDLVIIFSFRIPVTSGFLDFFAKSIATTFLLLVGISAVINYERQFVDTNTKLLLQIKRGFNILILAYLISITTFFLFPYDYISFGILHLIGYSTILIFPFLYHKSTIIPLALSVALLFVSGVFLSLSSNNLLLIPFGIVPPNYASLDYFPIFPWFSIILIGVVIGKIYYPWRKSKNYFVKVSKPLSILQKISRRSLLIYLIHQPIMFPILLLIKQIL